MLALLWSEGKSLRDGHGSRKGLVFLVWSLVELVAWRKIGIQNISYQLVKVHKETLFGVFHSNEKKIEKIWGEKENKEEKVANIRFVGFCKWFFLLLLLLLLLLSHVANI